MNGNKYLTGCEGCIYQKGKIQRTSIKCAVFGRRKANCGCKIVKGGINEET